MPEHHVVAMAGEYLEHEVLDDQASDGRAELEAQLVGAVRNTLGHAGQGQAVAELEIGLCGTVTSAAG